MSDKCEHILSNQEPRYCVKCQLWESDLEDDTEATESPAPSGQTEFDLLSCPCCGGNDIGEKGPYDARHDMRQYAYGCHTCGVVALTMISVEEAKKRFARRAI